MSITVRPLKEDPAWKVEKEVSPFSNATFRLAQQTLPPFEQLFGSQGLIFSDRFNYMVNVLLSRAVYLLGRTSLSTTEKYTQLAMVDIINAYDIAHPRA